MQNQTGKHVSLTTIRRLMRQTKLQDALLATTGEIEEYWIDACKQYKEVQKKAKALNGTHLITLDKEHAVVNGTTEASEKKIRLRIAAQRNTGRAIARVKRKRFHSVTKLSHTTSEGKQECTTQKDMSIACISGNVKRFSQTIDTPSMCAALIERMGYDAEKEGGKQILDGTSVSPLGIPKYMQKFLDHLRRPQIVLHRGTLSTLISTQEHIHGWKKQKEKTASYQGELTFNDFKAGSQDEHIAQLDCFSS